MQGSEMAVQTSIDVISSLLGRHPDITILTIFEPPVTSSLQDRLKGDPVTSALVADGLKIRNDLGLPFWDSLLVACFGVGAAAVPILEQAKFHNCPPVRTSSFLASGWSAPAIEDIANKLSPDNMLVLSSRVKLRTGGSRHIPMLDFHIPSAAHNQELVVFIANSLDPKGGFILTSGKSYHFYGKSLLTEDELPAFLGKALLFCPIIDRPWIAHQLVEGACGLRVSQKPGGTAVPKLLVEL
jgi:hypothetical protein